MIPPVVRFDEDDVGEAGVALNGGSVAAVSVHRGEVMMDAPSVHRRDRDELVFELGFFHS